MKLLGVSVLVSVCSSERPPWYVSVSSFHFPHFFATDMDGDALLSQIAKVPMDNILVEFYAPWCPHCQHFAPEYERLALTIKRFDDAEHQQSQARHMPEHAILAATVDCVHYESACGNWSIDSFPTLLWGSRADWLANDRAKLTVVTGVERSAEGVAQWINAHQHLSSPSLNASGVSKQEVVHLFGGDSNSSLGQHHLVSASSLQPSDKADFWDVQVAAALLLHAALGQIAEARSRGEAGVQSRQWSLRSLVELLERRFPEVDGPNATKCRTSLAQLRELLPVEGEAAFQWPTPDDLESRWLLCGSSWDTYGDHGWRTCRGTWPGKRGFTCGLWTMFHAVAARTEDATAGQDLQTMRHAVGNFFECTECREHFMGMPLMREDLGSRRAVQLWWWRTHNLVNTRVKGLEEQFNDGDPNYPKVQWPTAEACAKCQWPHKEEKQSFLSAHRHALATMPQRQANNKDGEADGNWNLDEVVSSLNRFYGQN